MIDFELQRYTQQELARLEKILDIHVDRTENAIDRLGKNASYLRKICIILGVAVFALTLAVMVQVWQIDGLVQAISLVVPK